MEVAPQEAKEGMREAAKREGVCAAVGRPWVKSSERMRERERMSRRVPRPWKMVAVVNILVAMCWWPGMTLVCDKMVAETGPARTSGRRGVIREPATSYFTSSETKTIERVGVE